MKKISLSLLLTLVVSSQAFALTVQSDSYPQNQTMPDKFTYCRGADISPHISWGDIPFGTKSFAIVMVDPDAGNWLHWKQYNIPANVTELLEGNTNNIGEAGATSWGNKEYDGPCPPRGTGTHNYHLTVYALNIDTFTTEPSVADIQAASIESATWVGTRSFDDNQAPYPASR